MIDLKDYTAVCRKRNILKFGNIQNEYEFQTEQDAKKFENLYNIFAIEAIKELMHIIIKYGVVQKKDEEKINEKDLAFYAKHYYIGGLSKQFPAKCEITLDDVLDKTKRVSSLSKDIKSLKEAGLV